MKKQILLTTFALIVTNICCLAQVKKKAAHFESRAQLTQSSSANNFQLFKTDKIWNFIKLDTRNGKIWQVQFDAEGENRSETILNNFPLAIDEEEISGRFTLYQTLNRWTFMLLDQIDGRTWQVQWSTESDKRLIIPIK